jgi:hypothetical protein
MNKDRRHILDELERFHQGKLDEVRAKRGHVTLDQPRQLLIGGSLNLQIDPRQHKVIVSWDK